MTRVKTLGSEFQALCRSIIELIEESKDKFLIYPKSNAVGEFECIYTYYKTCDMTWETEFPNELSLYLPFLSIPFTSFTFISLSISLPISLDP